VPRGDVYEDSKNGATLLSVIGGHAISAVQSVLARIKEVGAVLSQRRQTVRVIETGEMIPMRTPDPLVLDGRASVVPASRWPATQSKSPQKPANACELFDAEFVTLRLGE
jgi:hypothetical protein